MRSVVITLILAFTPPASAGFDSAYSDLQPEDKSVCKLVTAVEPGDEAMSSGGFECAGYKDFKVRFAEGDLRSFVSFGKRPVDHCASRQTFGGFNTVGKKVEWRLQDGTPFATILRWTVAHHSGDVAKQKTWLVVTKLEANNSCQMGYVEGSYPRANEKARWLADGAAEAFSCKQSKPTIFASSAALVFDIGASGGCEE
jgi:hypothetical protein